MFAGRHHLTALALCWLSRPLHTHAADINSTCSWQIAHDSAMSENGMLHSLHLLSACCTQCVCALKLCRNLAALFNVYVHAGCIRACRVCLCVQNAVQYRQGDTIDLCSSSDCCAPHQTNHRANLQIDLVPVTQSANRPGRSIPRVHMQYLLNTTPLP